MSIFLDSMKRPDDMVRITTPELAKAFLDEVIPAVQAQVGDEKVLLALSGGVDSSVVAALLVKAIGKQLACVHVNHGLMRKPHLHRRHRPLPGQAGRRQRAGKEAQDHRRRIHRSLRRGSREAGGR